LTASVAAAMASERFSGSRQSSIRVTADHLVAS
jgi:hypothetical protein